MPQDNEAASLVHEALGAYLAEGEIALSWLLTIDVAGPDETRYLAHRSGGGIDGTDAPTLWAAIGMLRATLNSAEADMLSYTVDAEDEDDGADD